jgi:hypothetical protein
MRLIHVCGGKGGVPGLVLPQALLGQKKTRNCCENIRKMLSRLKWDKGKNGTKIEGVKEWRGRKVHGLGFAY